MIAPRGSGLGRTCRNEAFLPPLLLLLLLPPPLLLLLLLPPALVSAPEYVTPARASFFPFDFDLATVVVATDVWTDKAGKGVMIGY